jgi:simple sugar transport system permease protein|tara:strand:+ start:3484 stop:4617 length:1134 start_codon:yes stop_codon:yes gene_type:complete
VIETLVNTLSPRWKLQRRGNYSRLRGYVFKISAVIISLLIARWAIESTGESAIELSQTVLNMTFKTAFGRKQFLKLATPLIINGAAMLLALRMQLFNFGLEGQLFVGAFAATAIGLNIDGPPSLILILMFLGGMAGGMLYALIPTLMRLKNGVSEILTTLLLNPLAIQFAAFIGMDAWRDMSLAGATANATAQIPYELPAYGEINGGFIIAVLIVIVLWLAFANTTWGYEVTIVGAKMNAARYVGMPVVRNMFIVMLVSGAIAGISGMIQLAEVTHRYSARLSQSYGWMGINVAILAGYDPLAILPWGLFLTLLLFAGTILKAKGMSLEVVIALTGLILFLTSLGEVLANYRLISIAKLEKQVRNEEDALEEERSFL